jgi:hypothetical protein
MFELYIIFVFFQGIKNGLILSGLFYETDGGPHEGSSQELALMVAKL